MTREKILRSHTIIPPELYVDRKADAQLQRTIADMGRPGYVLVARQMGKTNLLLQSRRRLGNVHDLFLYIDISNPFSDIRLFLRNIIDTFLDTYPDAFPNIRTSIPDRRESTRMLPPHKEHESELRQIIQAISGKLVICLDEIDALTKTNYADQVFSFIRSTYFSGRVNFPEFSRLTYVLSGVADPSELIKDKTVSPFNIGEKIYLDDFSREEFDDFLTKAQLDFERHVADRIYHWANGNPRMSWDICATLEDHLLSGRQVTSEIVDSTVTDMYLRSFDLPPVDHIRTLVEEDKVIRDAVVTIHYNKSETVSDALRNRLYLSGIVRPDQSGNRKLAIRNRILAESLSEAWIRDIERRELPTYELATKRYEAGKYEEALTLFDEYISSTNVPEEPAFLYFKVGQCQYYLERYQDSINSLGKCLVKKEQYPSLYYSIQHRLGLAHMLLGDVQKSTECFRRVLEQSPQDEILYFYFDACLNLSTALFMEFDKNLIEIRRLNQLVIDCQSMVYRLAEEPSHAKHILSIAHHNLAKISKKLGEPGAARVETLAAVQVADERKQVFFAIELSDLAVTQREREQILETCVYEIIDKRTAVGPRRREYPLDFTADVCARLVERLAEHGLELPLERLVVHLENADVSHEGVAGDILSTAAYGLLAIGNSKVAVKLIRRALSRPVTAGGFENRRHLFNLGILLTPFSEVKPLVEQYWGDYIESPDATLIDSDIRLVWGLVQGHIASGTRSVAERMLLQVRDLMKVTWTQSGDASAREKLEAASTLLEMLGCELAVGRAPDEELAVRARGLLRQFDKITTIPLPYFAEDFLNQMRNRCASIIGGIVGNTPFRRKRARLGRNERVSVRFNDGRVVEGKHKHFASQIEEGLCHIVDDHLDS